MFHFHTTQLQDDIIKKEYGDGEQREQLENQENESVANTSTISDVGDEIDVDFEAGQNEAIDNIFIAESELTDDYGNCFYVDEGVESYFIEQLVVDCYN